MGHTSTASLLAKGGLTPAQQAALDARAAGRAAPTTATTVTSSDAPPPPLPIGTAPAPVPFAQTQAGLTFAAETQRQSLTIQRQNAAALARRQQRNALIIQAGEQRFQRKQLERRFAEERRVRAEERERERRANISQLRIQRQSTFSELLASGDQVRAVIFALGFGPDNDLFDVRARQLGTTIKELKGARALEQTTQNALSRVLGRRVDIGRMGVENLGTAISSARAFVQGGADVQTLLTSAFGVGSLREGGQPGISAARLGELVESVTPRGVLP